MRDEDLEIARPPEVDTCLSVAGVPGACIAAVDREGRVRSWAWGRASLHPPRDVELGTRFHLFSGTKLYTATALVRLMEQGRVALADPVQQHLPELQLRHPVTLQQLASHDSGLPDTLRAFLAAHLAGERAPTTGEALAAYDLRRGKPPGRGVQYRNANYAILGEVISRVCGKPFPEVLREEVLGPLGSSATFEDGGVAGGVATGHLPRFSAMSLAMRWVLPKASRRILGRGQGRFVPVHSFGLDTSAIGGLVGSALDFVPLLAEMLNPADALLCAESKRQMLTQHASGAAGVLSRVGVGLGWKLGRVDGREFWNHEGGGPGFCSETRLYPSEGLGVVVLMNLSHTAALSEVAHTLCESIRGQGLG